MEAARLFATVSIAGVNASAAALRGFGGHVDSTQKGMSRLAGGSGQLAGGLVRLGAVAATVAAGGLAAIARTSIDFQDAFAGVRKTVDGSPAELDKLDKSLRALSTRIPVKYTDLAGIAQEAGALGVATKDVDAFTEAVARTSAATVGLSTEAAAEAFGKLGTIFKLSGPEFDRLGSSLVALGNAGASSEGDIIEVTKRFAAAGSVAKLSAAQVLGWSSAIASLGPEAESAGSSLSRTFNNITKYIGIAGKAATSTGKAFVDPLKVQSAQLRVEAATLRVAKAQRAHGASSVAARQATIALQQAQLSLARAQTGVVEKSTDAAAERLAVFAKVSGVSVAQFKDMFAKDASGAVDLFLTKLGQMDRFKSAAALKAVGIINVRDISAIQLLSSHTEVLNKQLGISTDAWAKNSELMSVSEKRFDTLKAKLTELKNTVQVGAAAIGDGMTPALGRLAKRAQSFVTLHMTDLEKAGKDIGAAIDGIDWRRVQSGAEAFVGVMRSILDIVRKIPPEILAAGGALVAVNKASGGLLISGGANVLQGAGEAGIGALQNLIGAKGGAIGGAIAGIGAQRVYVTNWPLGFGGGLGGGLAGSAAEAAGGGILAGAALPVILTAGTIAALSVAFVSAMSQVPDVVPASAGGTPGQLFSPGHGFGPRSGHGQRTDLDRLAGDASDARGLGRDLASFVDLRRASTFAGGKDDRVDLRQLARGTADFMADLRRYVRRAESDLNKAKPKDPLADVARIRDFIVKGQHGNVGETRTALASLRHALSTIHDPKLAGLLRTAIRDVGNKLDYRLFVKGQLDKANSILKSTESTKAKIADLTAIERRFVERGDTHAAAIVAGQIKAEKDHLANVTRSSNQAIAFAIRDKSWSTSVTLNPQRIDLKVDGQTLATVLTQTRQFGRIAV